MFIYLTVAISLFFCPVTLIQNYLENTGRMYVSKDQGQTWNKSDKGMPIDAVVNDILEKENLIFIATEGHGVYVSEGQEFNWHPSGNGLPIKKIDAIHAYNGSIYTGSFQGGIYRSDDDGASWYPFSEGLTNLTVRAFHTFNNLLIAGTNDGIFVLHKDKWKQLSNNLQINDFEQIGNLLFAATNRGVLMFSSSLENGTMTLQDSAVHSLSAVQHLVLGITYDSKIVRFNEKGQAHMDINFGIPRPNINIYSITPVDHYIFGQIETGFFKSLDYGRTWHKVSSGNIGDVSFRKLKNTKFGLLAAITAGKGGC